ncbi:MAG: PilN domain-containing protein [Gemmatimonadaceae bacterium]
MSRVGVELTATRVRAVRRDAWGRLRASADLAWDPESPDAVMPALRRALGGSASEVRLAVSPLLLRIKEVALPAIHPREQWRALALQPGRYFADAGESNALGIAWHAPSRMAFALVADSLDRWTRAFSALGPVTAVLPGPAALAAAALPDGSYEIAASADRTATASFTRGRLAHVRLVRVGSAQQQQLPPLDGKWGRGGRGHGGEWRAAIGAAEARAIEDWESLGTLQTQRVFRARRRRDVVVAALLAAAALVAAAAAWDAARSAYANRLDAAIAAAEREAEPALAVRRRLAGLDREASLLRTAATPHVDVLEALATLSRNLPNDVVVSRVRLAGAEWQVSGRARSAAAVVPALERDPRLADVRATSPSTRFRESAQDFETFAVSFRVRPSD